MYTTGTRLIGDFGLARVCYSGGWTMREHAHDYGALSLFFDGAGAEIIRGRDAHGIGPMSVVFKPAGIPHALDVNSPGLGSFQLRPPDPWQRALRTLGVLDEYRWDRSGLAAIGFLRLAVALAERDHTVAELAALSLARSPRHPPGPVASGVQAEIEHRFDGSCPTHALADRRGVHPSSLARAVRREIGCAPKELLARRRLVAAAAMLCGGSEPLASVAVRCGYADQSHMTRAFTGRLGRSPGRFRAAMAAHA